MSFQILKELARVETDETTQTLHHIKLSKPHIVRMVGEEGVDYAEVEYVLVGAARLRKEDTHGVFLYEETTVTASDEEAAQYKGYLYVAPRAMTVTEALFAIGELELATEPEKETK